MLLGYYVFSNQELIKKLEKGSDSMLAIVDMIRKENRKKYLFN